MKPLLCSSRQLFNFSQTFLLVSHALCLGFLGSVTYILEKNTAKPIHSCDLRAIKHISLGLKRYRSAWDVGITQRKFVNQDM